MVLINFKKIVSLIFSALLLSSCTNLKDDFSEEKFISLDSTNSLENEQKINRIVTLTSLSTDIIDKIDYKKLVAIPGSSLFKEKKEFANLPRISMGRTPPNLEKIVSLKPDLVIGTKGFHDKIISKLNDINIKTLSYEVRGWNDLNELIFLISNKLNLNTKDVVNNFNNEFLSNCIISKHNHDSNLIILASVKPLLSPNSNSWAGQMLERFNLNNLTKDIDSKSEFKGYVNLSSEWILNQDPDNLILVETRKDQFSDFGEYGPFSNLKSIKTNNVYRFNYYGLINPGSLSSIDNACKQLKQLF